MKLGGRRVARAMSVGAVLVLAAACGGSGGGGTSNTVGASASGGVASSAAGSGSPSDGGGGPATTVTVWTNNGAVSASVLKYLEQKFAPGNKDNITIKSQTFAGTDYSKQLPLALRTGQGPDVFSPNNLPVLVSSHFLMPLDDVVSSDVKDAYKDAYAAPSTFVVDGKLYAVPTNAVEYRLAYNKDLFTKAGLDPNKPPTTFSEVIADAKAITEKVKGSYGFGLPLKFNGLWANMMDPIMVQAKPNLTVRALYNTSTKQFESQDYEPLLTMLRTLYKSGWTYPGATSLDEDPMLAAFAQGKIGMFVATTNDVGNLDTQLHTTVNWSAATLPTPDDASHIENTVTIGGAWAINAKTKNKAAADKVLEAILSPELQNQQAQKGLSVPVSSAVDSSGISVAGLPQLSQFSYHAGKDKTSNDTPAAVLNVQGDTYGDINIKLITGSGSIADGLKSETDKYNAALQQAVKAGQVNLDDYATTTK